jgi:hypothetical protein
MADHIYEPNEEFVFKDVTFISPVSVPGGNHFIRSFANKQQKPLYLQPPKCKLKNGIVKVGKRMYCDFIFTQADEELIEWIDKFESLCQDRIFENRQKWFESTLEKHDIENSFSSTIKLYKAGKQYSMRVNVPTRLGKSALKVYNEQEEDISIDLLKEGSSVIAILEFQGIKCSARNFQVEVEVKQMMLLSDVNIFESCLFSKKGQPRAKTPVIETVEKEEKEEEKEETEEKKEKVEIEEDLEEQEKLDDDMCEVDLPYNDQNEVVTIKEPNEAYYTMYQEAKKKAIIARDMALAHYLEAKRIKIQYSLEDSDSTASDSLENMGKYLEFDIVSPSSEVVH